jgi:hypothetical protein
MHLTARTAIAVTFLILAVPAARAQEQQATSQTTTSTTSSGEPEREKHPVLMYIPNRIFDILDILRLRVRVGPGLAIGARATEAVDANLGAYTSIFAGIPGPRGRPKINLPVGVENYAGVELSVVGTNDNKGTAPHYGALEVGAGFQAALLGLDLGIDPLEILDLATGLVFLDLIGDDF